MPAAYSVSATAAYPQIDAYFLGGQSVAGPYTYGDELVVLVHRQFPRALTHIDSTSGSDVTKFMVGTRLGLHPARQPGRPGRQ